MNASAIAGCRFGDVLDVSDWDRAEVEEIGARDKVWLKREDESWLFKQGRASGLPEIGADL